MKKRHTLQSQSDKGEAKHLPIYHLILPSLIQFFCNLFEIISEHLSILLLIWPIIRHKCMRLIKIALRQS